MATAWVERRLAAILAADVVGYSRLIGRDESKTLARLRKNRLNSSILFWLGTEAGWLS